MKILTLTSSFPKSLKDISGMFVKDLGIELAKRGNEVLVLAPHSPGAKDEETVDGIEIRRFRYMYPEKSEKLGEEAMLPQIRSDFSKMLLLPFLFLSELLIALMYVRKHRVDAIHSHWILPQGLVGSIVSKITSRPHLLTIHSAGLFALEIIPFRRSIANFIVKNSNGITCVSSFGAKKLLEFLSPHLTSQALRKIQIVPMGVHMSRFEGKNRTELREANGLDPDSFLILFVGRLDEVKGVDYLVRAMGFLEGQGENVRLWIVGDGPLESDLRKFTRDLGLDRTVIFWGLKTGEELDDIFVMADAVAVPSVISSQGDTEGLPVVILESLAAGKPVVASNVGGIPDAIEDGKTGFLVPERSPEEISKAIVRVMKDDNLRDSLADNASEKAATHYSWAAVSERFDEILTNMVQEHGK
ncbi:MAG: glycosyltransferase family 4 protein [Methanobacteriota archaeon]|nr:MAG: glycosyltransferase family 4 protein [Euryarchaeota archaeon]